MLAICIWTLWRWPIVACILISVIGGVVGWCIWIVRPPRAERKARPVRERLKHWYRQFEDSTHFEGSFFHLEKKCVDTFVEHTALPSTQNLGCGFEKRTLFYGPGGSGKTRLFKRICKSWAEEDEGLLRIGRLIFFVDWRELVQEFGLNSQALTRENVARLCMKQAQVPESEADEFCKYMEEDVTLLFLVDGVEERHLNCTALNYFSYLYEEQRDSRALISCRMTTSKPVEKFDCFQLGPLDDVELEEIVQSFILIEEGERNLLRKAISQNHEFRNPFTLQLMYCCLLEWHELLVPLDQPAQLTRNLALYFKDFAVPLKVAAKAGFHHHELPLLSKQCGKMVKLFVERVGGSELLRFTPCVHEFFQARDLAERMLMGARFQDLGHVSVELLGHLSVLLKDRDGTKLQEVIECVSDWPDPWICVEHPYVVEGLLAKGVKPSVKALVRACETGTLHSVRALLRDGRVNPLAEENRALLCAAALGADQVVDELLKQGPLIRSGNAVGGAENVLDVLLTHERSIHVDGISRALLGPDGVIEELASRDSLIHSIERAFIAAVKNGRLRVVRCMLDHEKVDVKAVGRNALHEASRITFGSIGKKMMEVLLASNKIDVSPNDGALITAASCNNVEVVKLLLFDGRFDPTLEENAALRYCFASGHVETALVMLADPRVQPSENACQELMDGNNIMKPETRSLLLKQPKVADFLMKKKTHQEGEAGKDFSFEQKKHT